MSVLARVFPENPVLTKELRVRMRGARAYWILLGYLGFLSAVLLFAYSAWSASVVSNGSGGSDSSETGKNIFTILLVCQSFLVLFITPAITSGSITIEREQQTLDMLTMTRMSRAAMVAGKLLSAVSFTALLLVSSLPLVSICFMLGGVDPAMVVSTYVAMIMGAFLIGAIGMAWSSIAKTTTVAVLLTYLTMLLFAIVMSYSVGLYAAISQSPMAMSGGGAAGMVMFSIVESWCGPQFLGIRGMEYLGFGVLSLLGGILLSAIAMSRIETWPDRRAGLLRGLTALIVLVQVGACCVWWLDRIYGTSGAGLGNEPAIGVLCVPVLMLMALIPVFATGEINAVEARKFGRYVISGFTPRGLMRGKLASGVPFVTILTLLCLGVYAATFLAFGKPKDIVHSASLPGALVTAPAPVRSPVPASNYSGTIRSGSTVTVYRNGVAVSINGRAVRSVVAAPAPAPPPPAPPPLGFWENSGDFPQAALVILTFVIGFGLFCQFLSVMFGNRWVALSLSYLVLFLILFLPLIYAISNSAFTHQTVIEGGGFIDPLCALAEMTNANPATTGIPVWLLTSVVWTVAGAMSLLLTVPFVARRAMKSTAIPYEEMVTPV